MKKARDSNRVFAAVLTDLSKAFNCLLHDLLIAKLHTCGFDFKFLRVIHAYLNDRIQVTKVGSFYTETLDYTYSIPQGSILGLLLFSANLRDLLLEEHYKSDFSNYGGDSTSYNCRNTFLETISDLEIILNNLFNWFCDNNSKAYASKCRLVSSPFNAKFFNRR